MISCLLTKKDNDILMRMYVKKARLEKEAISDPSKLEAHLRQRNLIIQFVLQKLGPALKARVKTWTVRKYCDEADAESLVYEHVVMAVDKYKPEKGNCRFTSFLWTVSNRAFSNFISASKRQKRDPQTASYSNVGEALVVPIDVEIPNMSSIKERFLVSLDESTSNVDEQSDSKLTLADVVSDPIQIDTELEFNLTLEKVHSHCTEEQKLILSLLQQNFTYKEIADQLGFTPSIISRQIQQLRKKLKHELKQDFKFTRNTT